MNNSPLMPERIVSVGRKVLRAEAEAILSLHDRLGESFARAANLLLGCTGHVVLTGMGKSGLVARKIAATLASTGTPAVFLHPAEGIHGDLGMITRSDVVVAVSNSGETEEILTLLPAIKRLGVPLIIMTGRIHSTLARNGDIVVDIDVTEETWPMNLIPTSTTTAALAMGDALALAVLELRGLKPEDFALFHPGGSLGRRLLLRVQDLMHRGDEIPVVRAQTPMKDAILEMTSKRLGVTTVVDEQGALVGIITDGDLRRWLQKDDRLFERRANECMTRSPKILEASELAVKAVEMMERYAITSLVIVDQNGRPDGILHMHDILRAKIV